MVRCLVRRSSDAFAAAVAPFAQKEDEPLGYDFVPSCASPFNANLHSLPHCKGVVVSLMEEVSKFESCSCDTKMNAVDMVETSDVEDIRARVGLFTLVLKNGIFFVMPRLYLEAVATAKKALAKVGIRRHRV